MQSKYIWINLSLSTPLKNPGSAHEMPSREPTSVLCDGLVYSTCENTFVHKCQVVAIFAIWVNQCSYKLISRLEL